MIKLLQNIIIYGITRILSNSKNRRETSYFDLHGNLMIKMNPGRLSTVESLLSGWFAPSQPTGPNDSSNPHNYGCNLPETDFHEDSSRSHLSAMERHPCVRKQIHK